MYTQLYKKNQNTRRESNKSVAQKKNNGLQSLQIADNRSDKAVKSIYEKPLDNVYCLKKSSLKQKSNTGVFQLKKKGKITDSYIKKILGEIGNKELQDQLAFAWELIKINGEAYFDDEITNSFGGYDPEEQKLVIRVPEQNLLQWNDTTIEKKGIVIHELTHVAEVVANTGGMNNMNYDMKTQQIMETDYIMVQKVVETVYGLVEKEKIIFDKIDFSASSSIKKTLFGYLTERLAYAGMALQNKNSNYEFPTVVNQLVYVMDQKGNDDVKKSETYSWLKILEQQLADSRTNRFMKNAKQ